MFHTNFVSFGPVTILEGPHLQPVYKSMHDTELIVLLCSHVVDSSPLQLVLPHSNQFPFLPKANSE